MKNFVKVLIFLCSTPVFSQETGNKPGAGQEIFKKSVQTGSQPEKLIFRPESEITAPDFQGAAIQELLGLGQYNTFEPERQWERPAGVRFSRYQLKHQGIPVWGALYILSEKAGKVMAASGRLAHIPDTAPTRPGVTSAYALQQALSAMPAGVYAWQDSAFCARARQLDPDSAPVLQPEGHLVYAPLQPGQRTSEYRLAWVFDITSVQPFDRRSIAVDALAGNILFSLPGIHACQQPVQAQPIYLDTQVWIQTDTCTLAGSAVLYDAGRRVHTWNSNHQLANPLFDLSQPAGADWTAAGIRDAAGAHWASEMFHDVLRDELGWEPFPLNIWVNYGQNIGNALFIPGIGVCIGDGNGSTWTGPLSCVDIVSHEWMHGVIAQHSGLIYAFEPGALNEGLADVFGTYVEFKKHPAGGNYALGAEAYFDHENGLRRIDTPNSTGYPAAVGDDYWLDPGDCNGAGAGNDYCYIHHNATVIGRLFYLLSEGGQNLLGNGQLVDIQPLGMDNAAQLLFEATHYLTPVSDFTDARNACEIAMHQLGLDAWADDIARAWCVIGVGDCQFAGADSIVVTAPEAGDVYKQAQMQAVEWISSGLPGGMVRIDYSLNGGVTWQALATQTEDDGQYTWQTPNATSNLCVVRIERIGATYIQGRSAGYFSLRGCNTLAYFEAGDTYCPGAAVTAVNTPLIPGAAFAWSLNGASHPGTPEGATFSGLGAGVHTLALNVSDTLGCSHTFERQVEIKTPVHTDFTVATSGTTIHCMAGYAGGSNYLWTLNGGDIRQGRSVSYTAPDSGQYTIQLVVQDQCASSGASASQQVSVANMQVCAGSGDSWEQLTYTNYVRDLASSHDTIWGITDGGAFMRLVSEDTTVFFNTANSDLPSMELNAVVATRSGKVFFGSDEDGLGIYQNGAWETRTVVNAGNYMVGNSILALAADTLGYLMISFGSKMVKIRTDESEVKLFNLSGSSLLYCDGANYWGRSYDKLYKIDAQDSVFTYNIPAPLVTGGGYSLATDVNGIVWFSKSNGSLIRFDPASAQFTELSSQHVNGFPTSTIYAIEAADSGSLWLGTHVGLYLFDGEDSITHEILSNDYLLDDVLSLETDATGTLWVGTETGLYFQQNNNWIPVSTSSGPLLSSSVADIERDTAGNIWVESGSKLLRYTPDGQWTAFDCDATGNLEADSRGNMWTHNVIRYSPTGLCHWGYQMGFPGQSYSTWPAIRAQGDSMFFADKNNLYVCNLAGSGTYEYEWTTVPIIFNLDNNIPLTPTCTFDQNGALWIGYIKDTLISVSLSGAVQYHKFTNDPFYTGYVRPMFVDNQGNIWCLRAANSLSYLLRYNPQNAAWTEYPEMDALADNEWITCINQDSEGKIWVGYSETGVARFDPAAPASGAELYTPTNSGLGGYGVNCIFEDTENQSFWFGTNRGLSMLHLNGAVLDPVFSKPDQICTQQAVTFTGVSQPGVTTAWYEDGQKISDSKNLTRTYAAPGPHILTAMYRTPDSCEVSYSERIEIQPSADLSAVETHPGCGLQLLEAPAGMMSYSWLLAGQEVSDEAQLTEVSGGVYTLVVSDHCNHTATKNIQVENATACVHPGDTDNNGVVNQYDLSAVGHAFGYQGAARIPAEQGSDWRGHAATGWGAASVNGQDLKYADCNGDGRIDLADAWVVVWNYDRNWAIVNDNGPQPVASPVDIRPVLVRDSVADNRLYLSFDLMAIHQNELPIDNFYSAAFSLYYTPPLGSVLEGPPVVRFSGNTMSPAGDNLFTLAHTDTSENRVDIAATLLDHRDPAGVTRLARVDFIVIDDNIPTGDTIFMVLNLAGPEIFGNNGSLVPIGAGPATFAFSDESVGISGPGTAGQRLLCRPNPAVHTVGILYENTAARETVFTLHDAQGTTVRRLTRSGQHIAFDLDVQALPAGMYLLSAHADKGPVSARRIVVMR